MPGAIIIGAGPSIGAAVARRVAREGLPVAVIARRASTVDAVAAAAGGTPAGVTGVVADATDEPALHQALDRLAEVHGVPDLLVYNAAVIRQDRLGELTAREILDTYAVNVVGALSAVAHVGPRMARIGRGTVIVTGGMPAPRAEYLSLGLGKLGVRALTSILALELGPAGVHVATVTVADAVDPDTANSPDAIAELYWKLHRQPRDAWDAEVLFAPLRAG